MTKNEKHIVWDWNGTLLDDTHIVLVCVNVAMKRWISEPLSMEKFRAVYQTPLRAFYRAAGVAEESLDLALESESNVFHDNYESRAIEAPLRTGAADLLKRLKTAQVSSHILSNHIEDRIITLLDRHNIHGYFDEIMAYASRETQYDRPKGERLHAFIDANGLEPSNVIIVGDTVEEIEIGQTLGLTSVAITGGVGTEERLRTQKPDALIHSLGDLDPILKQRGFL